MTGNKYPVPEIQHRRWRVAALGLLVLLAAGALRAAPLEPFTAHYRLRFHGVPVADARISLEADSDGRYVYESVTTPGKVIDWFRNDRIVERSVWTMHEGRVRPLHYDYHHTGIDEPRHAVLRFDWPDLRVENTVEGETWHMAIPPDTLDKFAVQLALIIDLRRGERRLVYPIADGGKLKTYRFDRLDEETVETPAGTFDTVKVRRKRDDDEKRTTLLWCAPDLGYLPVQVEHSKEGEGSGRMVLESIEGWD